MSEEVGPSVAREDLAVWSSLETDCGLPVVALRREKSARKVSLGSMNMKWQRDSGGRDVQVCGVKKREWRSVVGRVDRR